MSSTCCAAQVRPWRRGRRGAWRRASAWGWPCPVPVAAGRCWPTTLAAVVAAVEAGAGAPLGAVVAGHRRCAGGRRRPGRSELGRGGRAPAAGRRLAGRPGPVWARLARPRPPPTLPAAGPGRPVQPGRRRPRPGRRRCGADGHLQPEWVDGGWASRAGPAGPLGRRSLAEVADRRQRPRLAVGERSTGPMAASTARAESAAELLCAELAVDGLPVDRDRGGGGHRRLRRPPAARPRPRPTDAARPRATREVLRHAPDGQPLRPAQPGPGEVAAAHASASRCPTPGPGGWRRCATPTRSSTPCWRGARPSGWRPPTATAGSTSTSAPTAGSGASGPAPTAPPGA